MKIYIIYDISTQKVDNAEIKQFLFLLL